MGLYQNGNIITMGRKGQQLTDLCGGAPSLEDGSVGGDGDDDTK